MSIDWKKCFAAVWRTRKAYLRPITHIDSIVLDQLVGIGVHLDIQFSCRLLQVCTFIDGLEADLESLQVVPCINESLADLDPHGEGTLLGAVEGCNSLVDLVGVIRNGEVFRFLNLRFGCLVGLVVGAAAGDEYMRAQDLYP